MSEVGKTSHSNAQKPSQKETKETKYKFELDRTPFPQKEKKGKSEQKTKQNKTTTKQKTNKNEQKTNKRTKQTNKQNENMYHVVTTN